MLCVGDYVNQPNPQDGIDVLAKVGDLIGRIAGVMLRAASCGLPVLLDRFLLMLLRSQPATVSCNQTVSHSFSLVGRKGRAYSALAFGLSLISIWICV
ncbi:nicotinate-nucleotide--dimethylbenzimidazole phosphoribosyltransferase [Shigella flexneri]